MKKLLLATVATLALSLPAMAQNQSDMNQSPQGQSGSQSQQQQSQDQNAAGNQQQAQNTIDPSQLSTRQIRQIQTALNKQGFSSGHVDGKWGPDTERAVKNFQQRKQMQATGNLDQQTLQALGVNMTAQQGGQQNAPQQPSAGTTGQAPSENQQPNAGGQNAPSAQPQSNQSQPQQQNQQ